MPERAAPPQEEPGRLKVESSRRQVQHNSLAAQAAASLWPGRGMCAARRQAATPTPRTGCGFGSQPCREAARPTSTWEDEAFPHPCMPTLRSLLIALPHAGRHSTARPPRRRYLVRRRALCCALPGRRQVNAASPLRSSPHRSAPLRS